LSFVVNYTEKYGNFVVTRMKEHSQ